MQLSGHPRSMSFLLFVMPNPHLRSAARNFGGQAPEKKSQVTRHKSQFEYAMCSLDHALPCTASASLYKQKMSPADYADIANKTADDLINVKSSLRTSAESAGNSI